MAHAIRNLLKKLKWAGSRDFAATFPKGDNGEECQIPVPPEMLLLPGHFHCGPVTHYQEPAHELALRLLKTRQIQMIQFESDKIIFRRIRGVDWNFLLAEVRQILREFQEKAA